MRRIRTIRAFMKASIGSNTAYRGSIVIWMMTSMIRVGVALSIWLAASNTLAGGYTRLGIINYYMVSMFFEWILLWNPFYHISQEIKSGQIVTYLVRPVSFFYAWFGREAGFKTVAVFLFSIVGSITLILLQSMHFPIRIDPTISWVFLFAAIPGAILISFLTTMCMASLGFWLTEVRYINYVYWTFMPLMGGLFLPTSFFPAPLEQANRLFLFRYQLSFPLEILFNRLNIQETIISLVIMCLWIVFLSWLYKTLWREGVKVYSAFGQ